MSDNEVNMRSSAEDPPTGLDAPAGQGYLVKDLIGDDLIDQLENRDVPAYTLDTFFGKKIMNAGKKAAAAAARAAANDSPNGSPDAKPKAPRKRIAPAPKLDADGNPIPKAPRKPRAKKGTTGAEDNGQDGDQEGESMTPKKKSPTKSKNTTTPAREEEIAHAGDEEIVKKSAAKKSTAKNTVTKKAAANVESDEDVVTPSTPVKKGAKAKKTSVTQEEAISAPVKMGTDGAHTTPSKKRARKDGDDDIVDSPLGKKTKTSSKMPTCMEDMSEADKTMVAMKKAGKSWAEIDIKYAEITGKEVAKHSLASRYARIIAVIVQWKDGDIERMLAAKATIDEGTAKEIAATIKKLEGERWIKTAELMVTMGADKYSATAVERCYAKEEKNGFPHRDNIDAVLSGDGANGNSESGGDDAGEYTDKTTSETGNAIVGVEDSAESQEAVADFMNIHEEFTGIEGSTEANGFNGVAAVAEMA